MFSFELDRETHHNSCCCATSCLLYKSIGREQSAYRKKDTMTNTKLYPSTEKAPLTSIKKTIGCKYIF